MIFLYSTVSSSKSIFPMVVITSPSFSSYCPCWTSASVLGCFGTAGCSFPLYCVSPRTSPCLGRRHLGCFACRWSYSSLACCWLCSSRFFSSSLQIFDVLLVVFVPSLLYFVLFFFSPLAHWLSFRLCFFFRVTLWQVTTPWLVSGFLPTSLSSIAPFVIDGSR